MKYNTIYAFRENNESGIRSRQVPVWRGLISIVLSVINSGPNNYYGIDRIPVRTGSGMYRLHCIISPWSDPDECQNVWRVLNNSKSSSWTIEYS